MKCVRCSASLYMFTAVPGIEIRVAHSSLPAKSIVRKVLVGSGTQKNHEQV